MSRSDTVRILMYSHDTYGLGHLTRTVRIARALRARYDRASILILSGSPVAPYVALPPGADIVKMPSVVKAGKDLYRSRDLKVSFGQIKRIRREMIRGTAASFQPDIFMVDNVPLGMKMEILPTLEYLRRSSRSTRIVLNLRDILDDPQVIRDAWNRDGVVEALEKFYDKIFVLGDREIFDAINAYALPRSKTDHVGYAAPATRTTSNPRRHQDAVRRVLLTAGGGGDGFSFLERTLEGLEPILGNGSGTDGSQRRIELEIVTGPLMNSEERRALAEKVLPIGFELHDFVPDLPERMSRTDLVVAMAGYNTCCEILSHANAALVWPRITPRVEQLLRAEAFEARGIASMLPPELTSPSRIREAVLRALEAEPIREADLPEMNGLDELARHVADLCPRLGKTPADPPSFPRVKQLDHGGRSGGQGMAFGLSSSSQWSPRYWAAGTLPTGRMPR